jgi:hypothetical protein
MGADCYIQSIFDKNKKKYESQWDKAIKARNKATESHVPQELMNVFDNRVEELWEKMYSEGYFRDSYNISCLFWHLGLSWWQLQLPFKKRESVGCRAKISKGLLSPKHAQILLEYVRQTPLPKFTKQYLKDKGFKTKDTQKELQEFFEKKKAEFEKFLERAIQLNEAIVCSV